MATKKKTPQKEFKNYLINENEDLKMQVHRLTSELGEISANRTRIFSLHILRERVRTLVEFLLAAGIITYIVNSLHNIK